MGRGGNSFDAPSHVTPTVPDLQETPQLEVVCPRPRAADQAGFSVAGIIY